MVFAGAPGQQERCHKQHSSLYRQQVDQRYDPTLREHRKRQQQQQR
jgi:hypothetical protein